MFRYSSSISLERVRKKVMELADKYLLALEEIRVLKQRNQELENQLKEKSDELESFQKQDKISRLVTSVATEGEDMEELKEKLGDYIREIDKCIEHLSEE